MYMIKVDPIPYIYQAFKEKPEVSLSPAPRLLLAVL